MSLPPLPWTRRSDQHSADNDDDSLNLTDAPLEATDEVVESPDTPELDLPALRSDDALLNALGGGGSDPFGTPIGRELRTGEPELGALLLSWRADVDSEPTPELVDTETAMRTIYAAAARTRRRPRYLVPVASAAAVLVIVFTGVGLAARDAQPGDALWGLTQVLYADHARSVVAADAVRTELSHASAALQEGHYSAARSALAQAQQTLPSVDNEDGQANLKAQQQNLLNQLAQSTGNSNLPTTVALPPQDSISSTLVPSTTPSGPPSSTTTGVPPTTTTSPSVPTSGVPTSTPPTSSPSLQSGTVSNSNIAGAGTPDKAGAGGSGSTGGTNGPTGSGPETSN